jgi:hypothetical protein
MIVAAWRSGEGSANIAETSQHPLRSTTVPPIVLPLLASAEAAGLGEPDIIAWSEPALYSSPSLMAGSRKAFTKLG